MKKIYLVRHAKSDWANPALSDFDRPLNNRGLTDARQMAERFKELDFTPEKIISSPAMRAISTAKIFCTKWGFKNSDLEEKKELYMADAQGLLKIITSQPDSLHSLMLVGHNPGLTEAAELLTNTAVHLPTCALVLIQFNLESWQHIHWGSGIVKAFEYPKYHG